MCLGSKTPLGALLGGRIMQDLCFSSPVFHARHVACNLPTPVLDTVLNIFGDPLMCCPCWDPCRTAELSEKALPHNSTIVAQEEGSAFSGSLVLDILMLPFFGSALLMNTMLSEMQSGLSSRLWCGTCFPFSRHLAIARSNKEII